MTPWDNDKLEQQIRKDGPEEWNCDFFFFLKKKRWIKPLGKNSCVRTIVCLATLLSLGLLLLHNSVNLQSRNNVSVGRRFCILLFRTGTVMQPAASKTRSSTRCIQCLSLHLLLLISVSLWETMHLWDLRLPLLLDYRSWLLHEWFNCLVKEYLQWAGPRADLSVLTKHPDDHREEKDP